MKPTDDPSRYEISVSMLDAFTRPAWMADAQCGDYDLDFIDAEASIPGTAAALQICGRCSVREACLDYALADPSLVGIWGGMDTQARKARRRSLDLGTARPVIRSSGKPPTTTTTTKEHNP